MNGMCQDMLIIEWQIIHVCDTICKSYNSLWYMKKCFYIVITRTAMYLIVFFHFNARMTSHMNWIWRDIFITKLQSIYMCDTFCKPTFHCDTWKKVFHMVITSTVMYFMVYYSFQCQHDLSHELNVPRHVDDWIVKYPHVWYNL